MAGTNFELKTGAGADVVFAEAIKAGNKIEIETNEGNDTVTVSNIAADNAVLLAGGAGIDTLSRDLDSIAGALEEKEFETIIEI